MIVMADEDTLNQLRAKYEKKIMKGFRERETADRASSEGEPLTSREYNEFKKENLPHHLNFYEKFCNLSEKIMRIEPDKKKQEALYEAIKICHLEVTPTGVTSFSMLAPIILAFATIFLTYILPSLLSPGSGSMFFVLFSIMGALGIIIPLQKLPFFLANNWRMKASNQMVLCIFYIVTYMRHTSNLERALNFAAEHLTPPLSLDLKKVLWDIESEKYDSLKESLDDYLKSWRKYNMEFIESMHLIESSLYESTEGRRLDALDKSLSVILEETYDKMLHYAHNLKGPITALHMLGIILPILGLVILPLLVSFMPEVKWIHLFMLYNIVLPVIVFYLARNILSTRPTGYGESDISETNKELRKYRNILVPVGKNEISISPALVAVTIFVLLFVIGSIPIVLHAVNPDFDVVISDEGLEIINEPTSPDAIHYFLGYRNEVREGEETGNLVGPFGLGATILSLALVLAFGIGAGSTIGGFEYASEQ